MARVIRGPGNVVPGEVVEAREEAERIVEEARAQAKQIVEEARAAAQSIENEARERGREKANAEAAALLVAAAAKRDAALASAEAEALKLAIGAAKHIIGEELKAAPDTAVSIVTDVLSRARRARDVSVEVHPDDAERVAEALDGVAVVASPAVGRGGCIVTTNLGELDARLEVRLEALSASLGID